MNHLITLLALGLALGAFLPAALAQGSDTSISDLPSLTPEQLEEYNFEVDETSATVEDLSLGQRFILDTRRRETASLVARHLGILSQKGDKRDLPTFQLLVDKGVIGRGEVQAWQSLGIVFGDVLAREFGLHWVSYEDDLGVSKALRWRNTENYVFPVTLFSKRVEFNEAINVQAIYDKLEADIKRFKEYERTRPQFKERPPAP